MKVVLINPYELGRQPFALAQPAAWLKEAGHQVCCLELSLQQLDDVALGHAELVAVYVWTQTAARGSGRDLPRQSEAMRRGLGDSRGLPRLVPRDRRGGSARGRKGPTDSAIRTSLRRTVALRRFGVLEQQCTRPDLKFRVGAELHCTENAGCALDNKRPPTVQ